jgi:hypothetical protein
MARKKRNQSQAAETLAMWDCVLHNLHDINETKLQVLEELGSDDEFLAKLTDAEETLGQIREMLDIPRDL